MPRIPGFGFLAGVVSRARSLFRGLRSRSAVEADMTEEFRVHIAMRAEDLMRDGLSRREATRQAHLEFGHVEKHKDAARASRGLRIFDQIGFSWLDVKLGLRMLVAHPGLTLVTGFALAVGIPVGMAPMHLANAIEAPLPEDPQNRVRAIRLWDPATTSVALPTYFELDALRSQVTTFQALGAFRNASYNVASDRLSGADRSPYPTPVPSRSFCAPLHGHSRGRTEGDARVLPVPDHGIADPAGRVWKRHDVGFRPHSYTVSRDGRANRSGGESHAHRLPDLRGDAGPGGCSRWRRAWSRSTGSSAASPSKRWRGPR